MGRRRLLRFAIILGITLLASTAQAGRAKKPVRRPTESTSAHREAIAGSARSQQTRKTAAGKDWRRRGQQAMEPKRVREIQAALIRRNYLRGPANGIWDQRSKNAMARFQSDNRWQSKVVPDSRALIKLGLGPDHAGLINPGTAALSFVPGGGTPTSLSNSQQ